MRALIYLTKRSFINNMKRALRKPTTLIVLILGIVYGIFIAFNLGVLAGAIRFDSVRGLIVVLTLWSIYMTLGNFMGYSARKGIIFRPAHAHFVFPAPLNPKSVLLSAAWMNYLMSVIIWVLLALGGLTVFQVPFYRVIPLFVTGCVFEIAFEVAVMVFLYTNDRLPAKLMGALRFAIKVVLIAFTAGTLLFFRSQGLSVESASAFVDSPFLQAFPVIGWQISAYRLILLGPTALNVVCTALYLIMVVGCVAGALRMKCDGGYYEEAAKFADDYAEIKNRQKNGEMVFGMNGKKRRFRRIKETIGGKGAKAVFYRQLLEYKKERFFFFDKTTLISAVLAFIFSYMVKDSADIGGASGLFLLGIVAYCSLVMSGYLGKWEKELKNPYIFLIPDTPLKKLWYATLMEHIKSLADGCIVCIPIGVFWHVKPLEVIYCILIYAVIQANRLYATVLVQCLVGELFGRTGQNVLRMIIQMTLLGLGVAAAFIAGIFVNMDFVFPIVLIYSMIVTVAAGVLASLRFDTMEQLV